MKSLRQQSVDGVRAGDSWTFTRTFTRGEVEAFGDLSRDYNPVHYDVRFARARKFKDVVCHGLLTASMISQIGGQLGWLAASMEFNFLKPVYAGDAITVTLAIEDVNEKGFAQASARFTNQDGVLVLTARLTGFPPGPAEQEVLRAMLDEGDPTNKLTQ